MRTTIRLEDALLRKAKARAAEAGVSLNEFIENAVRKAVAPRARTETAPRLPLFKGGSLLAGVDLDDSSALLDLMETDDAGATVHSSPARVAERASKRSPS